MTTISLGNELKDQYNNTSKWVGNGISWLNEVEEFYRERATLEAEYASKLKALSAKYFEKKTKVSAGVSVGDEPSITPGSLECASMVLWTDLLGQTEAMATEKSALSDDFNKKIADNIQVLRTKTQRIQKKIDHINETLVNDKTKNEEEVNKAKKHYDHLCKEAELARSKLEKSNSEKYQSKYQDKEVLMNNGKNEYIIAISTANRLKDKYYYQDIPELLDYLQELNESKVALFNKLIRNAGIIERNSYDKLKDKLHKIDETIDENDPKLDTAMFANHNNAGSVGWKEPADFQFVPCSFWHDDEQLIVKEPELTHLKKLLNIAIGEHSKHESNCIDYKQALEEESNSRKFDPSTITLKFDLELSKSLGILDQFLKEDSQRVRDEVKIEVIQNYAGDKDLTYIEQETKKKSRFGLFKSKRSSSGASAYNKSSADNASIHTSHTSHSANTHHTTTLGLFSLRKGKHDESGTGENGNGAGEDAIRQGVSSAKVLYQYQAQGSDETDIVPGTLVDVIEMDDGSGWTLVSSPSGRGLVPSSYLEIITKKSPVPPPVAPKRGAKRVQYVEALFEYNADGDDEISIRPGDRIIVLSEDVNGWTEGELNGQRGVFPTSYVKTV